MASHRPGEEEEEADRTQRRPQCPRPPFLSPSQDWHHPVRGGTRQYSRPEPQGFRQGYKVIPSRPPQPPTPIGSGPAQQLPASTSSRSPSPERSRRPDSSPEHVRSSSRTPSPGRSWSPSPGWSTGRSRRDANPGARTKPRIRSQRHATLIPPQPQGQAGRQDSATGPTPTRGRSQGQEHQRRKGEGDLEVSGPLSPRSPSASTR